MQYLIQNMLYDVADEILEKNNINDLKKLKLKIDTLYQKEIIDFKIARDDAQEVLKYGKYHPDFKSCMQQLSLTKTNLYKKEEVMKYLKLEKDIKQNIENFLNEVLDIISPLQKTKKGSCHAHK